MHRVGVEIELLAPSGTNRRDLAFAIAAQAGGTVEPCWLLASEIQPRVDPTLHHLTPGFDVCAADGSQLVRLIDDVSINAELDHTAPERADWMRLLSDEKRILQMLEVHVPPWGVGREELDRWAEHFGLAVQIGPGRSRLVVSNGAPAVRLDRVSGDRDRVAECVSPPLTEGLDQWFETVLGPALDLGFTLAKESATHFHLDASLFKSAPAFQALVEEFAPDGAQSLRARFSPNPNCVRVGPMQDEIVDLVREAGFADLEWAAVVGAVRERVAAQKGRDLNVRNLFDLRPKLPTVEFRSLPGSLDAAELLAMAETISALADSCREGSP